jgi:hypothetical protein
MTAALLPLAFHSLPPKEGLDLKGAPPERPVPALVSHPNGATMTVERIAPPRVSSEGVPLKPVAARALPQAPRVSAAAQPVAPATPTVRRPVEPRIVSCDDSPELEKERRHHKHHPAKPARGRRGHR